MVVIVEHINNNSSFQILEQRKFMTEEKKKVDLASKTTSQGMLEILMKVL